jgi:hypothetical protein
MEISEDEKHSDLDHQSLGLTEDQLRVLDQQVQTPKSSAGYFAIYRYAKPLDVIVMVLSGAIAAGAGATLPLMTVRPFQISMCIQKLMSQGRAGISRWPILGPFQQVQFGILCRRYQ